MEGTIPGPALHYSFGCVSRQKRKWRCVPRAAWHLEGALGSIIFQRDAGKRTKHGAVQKPQTCNLSKSQRRPVHPKPRPHSSQISRSSRGRESLFPRSQPKGEDRSALFGFHRFDPEINCQGLHDTPYQSQAKCHNEIWAGCQDRLPDSCYSFILKDLDLRNQTPALKASWPVRASFSEKQKPTPAPSQRGQVDDIISTVEGSSWTLKKKQ